jgi:hypothetical protein
MNRTLSTIIVLCTVALAGLVAYQWQRTGELQKEVARRQVEAVTAREKVAASEMETRKLAERAESFKAAADQLQERNKALIAQLPTRAVAAPPNAPQADAKVPAAGEETAADGEGGGDFMKGIAKMYSDPKMKEMLRSQQAMGVNLIYGGLAKDLALNKDEAREVMDILLDRQMEAAESSMKIFEKGQPDPEKMQEAGEQSAAAREVRNQELRETLGPGRYKKFEDYEKTIGERMALEQVEKQLAAGGTPLAAGQSQSLLEIMKQERLRTPPTTLNSANPDQTAQLAALRSDTALDEWNKSQEAFNRRILDRARPLLNADQLTAFEAAQKQQLSMQQMGMRMGQQMMKKGKE